MVLNDSDVYNSLHIAFIRQKFGSAVSWGMGVNTVLMILAVQEPCYD